MCHYLVSISSCVCVFLYCSVHYFWFFNYLIILITLSFSCHYLFCSLPDHYLAILFALFGQYLILCIIWSVFAILVCIRLVVFFIMCVLSFYFQHFNIVLLSLHYMMTFHYLAIIFSSFCHYPDFVLLYSLFAFILSLFRVILQLYNKLHYVAIF